MTDTAHDSTAEAQYSYLTRLADEVTRRGFLAEPVSSRTGAGLVRVVNPEATVLRETVHCLQEPDGSLWLAWPWGTMIARADETRTAADAVVRVLGTGRGVVADG